MNMRVLLGLAFVALGIPGCAGLDCPSTDWRQLGERDGVLGAQHQAERYAASCGNAFDAARYREGFQGGVARRPGPFV